MSDGIRFWLKYSAGIAALLVLLAWGVSHWHLDRISALVADRLMLLNELRKDALQEYFHTAEAELLFWGSSPDIVAAQDGFRRIWQGQGADISARLVERFGAMDSSHRGAVGGGAGEFPVDGGYGEWHGRLHEVARQFVTGRGYYDFFLIGAEGTVFYTVEKEEDFTSNLASGPLKDSHLAQTWRRAMAAEPGVVAISDMQSYAPSNGDPAIFMALAMRDAAGAVQGVIAFQLPTARIVEIMNYTSGMGRSGETYLVGEDLLMRSNSRFVKESTILRQRVDTPHGSPGSKGRGRPCLGARLPRGAGVVGLQPAGRG